VDKITGEDTLLKKTRIINGHKVTITQPKSNFIAFGIVTLLSILSFVGVVVLPKFSDLFWIFTIVFGLMSYAYSKVIFSDPF
jgi:hypothetical protein